MTFMSIYLFRKHRIRVNYLQGWQINHFQNEISRKLHFLVNLNLACMPMKLLSDQVKPVEAGAICGLNQQHDGDARHGEHEPRDFTQPKRFTKNQPGQQHNPGICAFVENGRH
jgi:hypothetical protein